MLQGEGRIKLATPMVLCRVACPTEERNAAVTGLIFPVPTVDGMVLEALFLLFPMHLQLATAGVGAGILW